METKFGGFVSMIRDRSINASIESLQTEGLRFSIDSLAEKLKISKKTIYKYFPNKEALALAMYEKYYQTINNKMQILLGKNENTLLSDILFLYYESKRMTRSEIFNKYKLNDVIRSYTTKQNNDLWDTVATTLHNSLSADEISAMRLIIDGTFEKLCEHQASPEIVIERLVKMIC